jgi:hypothetical protein
MATLAGLRERVRVRLEEAVPAIWSDDELDECLATTLETYAARFPHEVITTHAVADGTRVIPLPSGTQAVRRLTLADETVVPLRGAPRGAAGGDEELAWEAFGGCVHLSQPLPAQTLTLWTTAVVTPADLPAADEGLIVLGAVAQALELRAIQDLKRGSQLTLPSASTVVAQARERFALALDRRSRRLRAGLVIAP